jgi:hypothetical protein
VEGWTVRIECGFFKPVWGLWVALLLIIAVGWFVPNSASGAFVPQPSIGSPGSGDGEMELVAPNLPVSPRTAGSGLAANESSHNIYVGDTDNHRVTVLASNGTFVGAFGADVGGPGVDVCAIGCVAGTSGTAPGAFEDPTFVAVDNSAGPSSGDVYVVDSSINAVSKFESDGTLLASWGTAGQLFGDGSETFGQIGGIAVDSVGTLDVFKASPVPRNIFQFAESGGFEEKFLAAGAASPGGLAVDPGGDFFKMEGTPRVQKLNSDGSEIGRVSNPENSAGLAIDSSTGDLFVLFTDGTINRYIFESSGEVVGTGCTPAPEAGCPPTEALPPGGLASGSGLAVDSATQTVYAADPGADNIVPYELVTTPKPVTKPAGPVNATTTTLNGEVNPNGTPLTECFFEWGETTAYGETTPCADPDAEEVGEGIAPVAVHADISGLKPGTTYHFQLAVANANNAPGETISGGDENFLTLGPSVREESVSQVTATGARISGEINPNGKATTFVVQYVTEAQFTETGFAGATEVPVPPQQVGSGTEFGKATQQLSDLKPQTAYRFRLLVANQDASTTEDGGKFTTFSLPTTDLPDGRRYEMVTPPQKTGEVIPPEPSNSLGGSCTECLPASNRPTLPMGAASDRESVLYEGQPFAGGLAAVPNEYISDRGPSGWGTESLSPPSITGQYEVFSSDLSRGVLRQASPALSPEAPIRGGEAFSNLYLRSEDGSFEPLVKEEPPVQDPRVFQIRYAGANSGAPLTPEFSHLIFEANDKLTEGVEGIAPAAPEKEASGVCGFANCNLYEWIEGELRLVNVLPGNEVAATEPMLGSGKLLAPGVFETPDVDHAISDDGSRIFWTAEESGQIYVRIGGEGTLEVPGPGSCKATVLAKDRACFLTAAADGSSVLLSDGQLFELDEEAEIYEESADLTEGQGGFEGILGTSEDLSMIYFVDTAELTGGEENSNGEEAEASKLNLYAWEEGAVNFIGRLRAGDNNIGLNGRYGAWKASRPGRTAQVSPDGRYLAFMSLALLTGYDNRLSTDGKCPLGEGATCFEVFTYAADSETLTCASCNPSGQRPIGPSNLSLLRPKDAPFPQLGNLSKVGEGRLFFESQDALLPQDVNGNIQDIYEWEPNEVGSCERAQGCVHLISSGSSANDSMFLDSTPSGNDVFFITREQLLLRDRDEQLDLYDARVGGGFEETPIAPCSGAACKGPIAQPLVQANAGSSNFVGPLNPKPKLSCKKGFVKKNDKCVKKKPKKKKGQAKRRPGGSR